jgi:DMSO/TMAO reductase YedYZ molybdopterin-dependent catalytic subunit
MPTMSDAQIGKKANWKLTVEGVKKPRTFTLAQLQQLGQTTVATVLQCSGNGRGFFNHKPSGSQWKTGAAACLVWTGCPVSEVVKACGGIASGAKFMTSTGADMPASMDPKKALVERSVPLKVYKDAILAWEVNGVDIPNAHGGPLRTITPGYFGINNVKHVGKLAFTAKESSVKYMKSSYRISPIGKKGSQYPTCWEMPVKSWITSPLTRAKNGNVVIQGVAFGSATVAKPISEKVVQLGDRVNLLNRLIEVILNAMELNLIAVESNVRRSRIVVSGLSHGPYIHHVSAVTESMAKVDFFRSKKLHGIGKHARNVRVPLKTNSVNQREDLLHLNLIVDIIRENILIQRVASRSMHKHHSP